MANVGSISARVALDTAEFRQGIRTMGQQISIAREDFRQVTAGLDRVDDAMTIAAARTEQLTTAVGLQERVVEQMREAHRQATEQFGEGSAQAVNYELQLRRAETTLVTLRTSLDRTTQEITNFGNASDSSSAHVNQLNAAISNQEQVVDRAREALRQATDQFGEGSTQAQRLESQLQRSVETLGDLRTSLVRANEELATQATQLPENQTRLQRFTEANERLTERMAPMRDALKNAATGLAALGAAAVAGLAVAGVKAADELQKALNGLQASTGTADEKMSGMKESMLDIYGNNFGESFEDISKSMGLIATQTKLSGIELTEATKSALALRDTFEFEVSESTRAVNQLMIQFGLNGNDAYNLIAQGAQNGLNKNEDLMDIINEYSVQFAGAGVSAEQMFNMLLAGADAGAFSIDVLGDGLKEFVIRAGDGSKKTKDAFTAIGLDADETTKKFVAGGASANQAFKDIILSLSLIKDPLEQSAQGVELFGTKWEDLRKSGILALNTTNSKINLTIDALKKINEVKYNTFGEAITGLGRQFEVGLAIPIGQKILPELNKLAKWASDNMPQIKSNIEVAMNAAFVAFDGFIVVVKLLVKNMDLVIAAVAGVTAAIIAQSVITGAIALYTAWTAATTGLTFAQWALNAAMTANPVGLVVVAIGALVAAATALYLNWDKVKQSFLDLPGPIKILVSAFTLLNPAALLVVGIVAAIKGVQFAMSDAIPAANLFGTGISDATKKAVEGYLNLSNSAEKSLLKMKISGEIISKETSINLTDTFAKMGEQIKGGMEEKFNKSLEIMRTFFLNSKTLTETEETLALEKMKQNTEDRKKIIDEQVAKIQEILRLASEAKRALTLDEQIKINQIQLTMKDNAVKNLSQGEVESKIILERMKQQASEITALQAAEIVKNSLKTKEETVKNAEEQYSKSIAEIIKMRDESGAITAEQAANLIAEATKQRDESVNIATDMHTKIISQAKLQAKEHVNEVEWTTGQIKSNWDVWFADWKEAWRSGTNDALATWKGWANSFTELMDTALSVIQNISGQMYDGFINLGTNLMDGLINGIKSSANWLYSTLDGIVSNIKNKFSFSLPSFSLPSFSMPSFASGVNNFSGGIARINERGGEIVNLPSGANVIPHDISMQIATAMGQNNNSNQAININLHLDGKVISQYMYNQQRSRARGNGVLVR